MPETKPADSVRQESAGIIGAGPAGLITAYTLLQDGFQSVQILTRDHSVGGVWAKERVYPDVTLNSVHGEFVFSSLPMPLPAMHEKLGSRLCGADMIAYFEKFADTYLAGKIRFETDVLNIQRATNGSGWDVEVRDLKTGNKEVLSYARIVLCTGGCSQPHIPEPLLAKSAQTIGFQGTVLHTSEFASNLDQVLSDAQANPDYSVVVVGGGKSAQDISSLLARHDIRVSVVFEKADSFMAAPVQPPDWIRKSRFLPIFSPHIELRTNLERFLHTTTLGCMITTSLWDWLASSSYDTLKIPPGSPLRNTHSLFWGIRGNDEGSGKVDGFHALANKAKIKLVAPNRVKGYSADGESLLLRDGQMLRADLVILATGYTSSWTNIFTEKAIEELGIGPRPPSAVEVDEWEHYKTLASPPLTRQQDQRVPSIYRGLVPAKNITKRDFAINGAVFTTNSGYTFEVAAHWISSYFLGDKMRLPSTVEEALGETERYAAWMTKRYPGALASLNESATSGIALWTWPQAMDDLLEDMGLRTMRSGGNWLTWPFKVITVKEIATLSEERQLKRKEDVRK